MEVELWLGTRRKRIRSSNKLSKKQTRQQRTKMRLKMVEMAKLMLIQQQLPFNQSLKQRRLSRQQPSKLKKKRRKKNLMTGKMPLMMLRTDWQRKRREKMCPWQQMIMKNFLRRKRKKRKKKWNRMSIKERKKVALLPKKQFQ